MFMLWGWSFQGLYMNLRNIHFSSLKWQLFFNYFFWWGACFWSVSVFCLVYFSSASCAQWCCLCRLMVHSWLPLKFSLTFMYNGELPRIYWNIQEKFGDTEGVIRSCKPKKDCQMKKANKILKKTLRKKLKIEQHEPHKKNLKIPKR